MADEIAQKSGIFTDSDYRVRAGILYDSSSGLRKRSYITFPKANIFRQASELLKVAPETMDKHLMDMQIDRKLVVKNAGFSR